MTAGFDVDAAVKALKDSGFKEAGLGDVWNFEESIAKRVFRGALMFVEEGVGENRSNLYHFEGKDKKEYCIWGSSILDSRLKGSAPGQEVAIVFLGRKPSPKKGRSDYKDFRVFKM